MGLGQAHAWVQVAVAHFADDGQQRDFEEDHMQPGPFEAQVQLVALDTNLHIAQVEAEQAQKAQEVGLEEADAFEEGQLAIIEGEFAQPLELIADLAEIGAQVFAVAAAEFPLHVGIRVVVQHALHHRELVEVGVEQVVHDALGECALAHQGGLQSGEWRSLCHRKRAELAGNALPAGAGAPAKRPKQTNQVFFRAPASLETVPPVAVAHQWCALR
ncbi:hypothetical protein D3C81_1318000 [compost metagenome]